VTILAGTSAQPASVREVFENYGLLGNFAGDCSQPASSNNGYIIYRAIDAGHVQRDTMTAPTNGSMSTLLMPPPERVLIRSKFLARRLMANHSAIRSALTARATGS
jgi:hypothetical protein